MPSDSVEKLWQSFQNTVRPKINHLWKLETLKLLGSTLYEHRRDEFWRWRHSCHIYLPRNHFSTIWYLISWRTLRSGASSSGDLRRPLPRAHFKLLISINWKIKILRTFWSRAFHFLSNSDSSRHPGGAQLVLWWKKNDFCVHSMSDDVAFVLDRIDSIGGGELSMAPIQSASAHSFRNLFAGSFNYDRCVIKSPSLVHKLWDLADHWIWCYRLPM